MRLSLALSTVLLMVGCYDSFGIGGDASRPDLGRPDAAADVDIRDDGAGACCPLSSMGGCDVTDELTGGWAPSLAECPGRTSLPFGPIYEIRDDARGCPAILPVPSSGCLMPPPPAPCELFSETECYGADGCAPVYEDFCCPSCVPSPMCADCVDYGFLECRATVETGCADADGCAGTPDWGCDPREPADCGGANIAGPESCDEVGCVPAVGAVGAEELPPRCVPVTAGSCVALCSALPPECPEGTTAQADGGCWTGVCIPRRVCFG